MADLSLTTSGRIEVVESIQQITVIAAEAITAGEICRLDTDGKAVNADGSSAGVADAVGMATKAAAAGEPVTLLRRGVVDGIGITGLAYGAKVYLSDTDDTGSLADAAGTVSVVCGRVIPALGQTPGTAADKLLLVEINS